MKNNYEEILLKIQNIIEKLNNGESYIQLEILEEINGWLQVKRSRNSWQVVLDLASAMWQYGDLDNASNLYNKAIKQSHLPMIKSRAFLGKGIIAVKQLNYKEATSLMQTAAKIAQKQNQTEFLSVIRKNQLTLLHEQQKWREFVQKAICWTLVDHVLYVDLMIDAADMMTRIRHYDDAIAILVNGKSLMNHEAPIKLKIKWLEAIIINLRASGDDYLAQSYCLQAVEVYQSSLRSEIENDPVNHQSLSQVHNLLSEIYVELAENNPELKSFALFQNEFAKNFEFSSPFPSGNFSEQFKPKEKKILLELASAESALDYYYRKEIGADRVLENIRNTNIIKNRSIQKIVKELESFYSDTSVVQYYHNNQKNNFAFDDFKMNWPQKCVGLVYRLDRKELLVHAILIHSGDNIYKFTFDINYASIRSILDICKMGIARELEFMAERLTEVLLPKSLRKALWSTNAETLFLSPDPHLEDVPWEAIGLNGNYLGTDFNIVITPSLIRSLQQISFQQKIALKPTHFTLISNPTNDLPHSNTEAKEISNLLSDSEQYVVLKPACKHQEFTSIIEKAEWLHYAGHANYLNSFPSSSYIHLNDYLLTVRELGITDILQGSVWILNACEAAQSSIGGEGVGFSLGLSKILLLKNVSAIIAANWPTADAMSSYSMVQFYRELLKNHLTLCGAIRKVRQSLINDGFSMYEWAQYSFLGNPYVRLEI